MTRGRAVFTKKLCKKLVDGLRIEHGRTYGVEAEARPFPGWDGVPDACVTKPGDRSESAVIIEVEHWSSQEQAQKNIEQAIAWAESNPRANVAFIHFVNTSGNVTPSALNSERRDLENWQYRLICYAHERDDRETTTSDKVDDILSTKNHRAITSALTFAFTRRAPASGSRAARGEVKTEKRGGKKAWVVYVGGKQVSYFLTEEKARQRLAELER